MIRLTAFVSLSFLRVLELLVFLFSVDQRRLILSGVLLLRRWSLLHADTNLMMAYNIIIKPCARPTFEVHLGIKLEIAVIYICQALRLLGLVRIRLVNGGKCDLIIAQHLNAMLLLELLFVLNAATRQDPEQKVVLINGGFHHFDAHASQEKSDELGTGSDDQDQN